MGVFSLYIHIPYCHSKCHYCDFNSWAAERWPEGEYTAALIAELGHYAERPPWRGAALRTVFFGGGTPSLFDPTSIGELLAAVERLWPGKDREREVTLEANPGTVSQQKLGGFVAAGVNRLSLGVQSFEPQLLSRLGRIHSSREAVEALQLARRAGVANLNIDLIFAVPEQIVSQWEDDLRMAIDLAPDHISAYNLTFEEGTPFEAMRRSGVLEPAGEEMEAAMFARAREMLGAAGYRQYEISNYALPGRECRHNLNYWGAGEYLGVGAGAHSFTRQPSSGVHWSNEKSPNGYIDRIRTAGQAREFQETLSDRQARGEFVFLGLRCRAGFDGDEFVRRFGVDLAAAFPHAAALVQDGVLERAGRRWRLSERGLPLADGIFATFV